MKPLDLLFPRIMPRARNCPAPVAEAGIRAAAIEFCERTRLWRFEDSFETSEASCDVVAVPYGAVLHEIESARFNGSRLEPVSISWLDDEIGRWREMTASAASWITQVEPNTVRVVPAAEGRLDLSLILKPSNDASELPDWMIQSHAKELADGALAEILTIPGQPFYNPDLAIFHANRFRAELDRLFNANIKGQQRAPTRTKPHFF